MCGLYWSYSEYVALVGKKGCILTFNQSQVASDFTSAICNAAKSLSMNVSTKKAFNLKKSQKNKTNKRFHICDNNIFAELTDSSSSLQVTSSLNILCLATPVFPRSSWNLHVRYWDHLANGGFGHMSLFHPLFWKKKQQNKTNKYTYIYSIYIKYYNTMISW